MVITEKTLTRTILPYITSDLLDELMDKCDEVPLEKSIFRMTCGEFIESLDDKYVESFFNEKYIINAIGKLKTYKREMEQLDKYMKINEFTLSSDEEKAKQGVVFPTFPEHILMTVTEYFHLHSFDEAENIPFSNYLIITKSKNADSKYERNYQKIIENKAKMNKK